MSWQDLVDNNLLGTGHVSKAAICGLDGSIWGKSSNFNVNYFFSLMIFLDFRNGSKRCCQRFSTKRRVS